MARVAANRNSNVTATPFLDQLSHEVIKETSKSLRHYIDVKRRENGFILNPNSSAVESAPIRARYMYGTAKQYPPLYGSSFSDNDIKIYMRSFQQQQRHAHNPSDKRMCREELNYHMRPKRSSSKENQKFAELRLRPSARSTSAGSMTSGRDFRREMPRSAFKLSRFEQSQLVDDTASILASMVKTRRSIYETNLALHTPHQYISANNNSAFRPTNEQTPVPPKRSDLPRTSVDSRASSNYTRNMKSKRRTSDAQEEELATMRRAKPITKKGLLCDYKVTIRTGDRNGASTDAPIRIMFFGTNGCTDFSDLTESETHRVPFCKDQTDVFTVSTDHVGQLAGIRIGHNQTDMRSGWFLNNITVFDPIRQTTSEIPCNAWLSNKADDQKTMRDLPVVKSVQNAKAKESHKHEKAHDSQSDHSATARKSSATSESTIRSGSITRKQTKKHHHKKQPRRSDDSITLPKKSVSSPPPPATTIEHHYDQNEFSPVPSTRRTLSPHISTPSSESEHELDNRSHSSRSSTSEHLPRKSSSERDTPPAKTGTVKTKSIQHRRPSSSSSSTSSGRPIISKNKEEKEKDNEDAHSFFE
ncbi:unnamed protein product [Adineta ricciae]|uniref:PLAT domain-containing protein n=1 Tax=Adineta ricciae TaxID=249248 RepID=A0A816CH70_ADIRI|nr:unnamed protein product [Adineta ricciae]